MYSRIRKYYPLKANTVSFAGALFALFALLTMGITVIVYLVGL